MSTREILIQAAKEIGAEIKNQLVSVREQIKSDREKVVALEEYVQTILDAKGTHVDEFENGQQSVALAVAEIIGYEPKDKEKNDA